MRIPRSVLVGTHTLQKLFLTPTGWIIASITALFIGILHYHLLVDYLNDIQLHLQETKTYHAGVTFEVIRPLFGYSIFLFIFIIPLLTILAFASEKQKGVLSLLCTFALKPHQIILGKFIGIFTYTLFLQAILLLITLCLNYCLNAHHVDWGLWIGNNLAFMLINACLIALSFLCATVIRIPILSAVTAIVLSVLLFMCQWLLPQLSQLSISTHTYSLLQGELYSPDIAYFFTFILLTLFLVCFIERKGL